MFYFISIPMINQSKIAAHSIYVWHLWRFKLTSSLSSPSIVWLLSDSIPNETTSGCCTALACDQLLQPHFTSLHFTSLSPIVGISTSLISSPEFNNPPWHIPTKLEVLYTGVNQLSISGPSFRVAIKFIVVAIVLFLPHKLVGGNIVSGCFFH